VLSFAGTTPILLLALYLHSGVFLYNILRIIMFVFIIAALMFFVQKPYRKIQKEIEKGWLIFCVLPAFEVIVNFSLIAIFPGKWGVLIPTSLILLLLLFAIYAIFYYVFMQLRGKYDLLERERLMLMQNYYGKLLLEQQEKSIEKIQHLRHDMRHYVRTALSMMEHGNITDAAEQFTRFLKNVDNVPLKSFCDNKTANYVFSYFAEKAKNENINFGIESVIPDECGIDSVDLGGILSNLLENAVEGCLRISDVSLRSIRLSCTKNDSIMLIRSENSCVQEIIFKDDMPVSSKESGGIGTQSIMRAVQMYNGIADFSVKDGTFFVKIILHGK
jgi:signal transduction histidine kinase